MHLVSKCPFAICWPRGCRRFTQADGVVLAFEKQRHQTRVQTLETISVSLVQLPACTTHLLKAASLPAALDGPTPTLPTSMPLSSPALKALLFFLILHGRGGASKTLILWSHFLPHPALPLSPMFRSPLNLLLCSWVLPENSFPGISPKTLETSPAKRLLTELAN